MVQRLSMRSLEIIFCVGLEENKGLLRLLCDAGADFNALDDDSETPLFYAVRHRRGGIETLAQLIAHGANYHVTNAKGENLVDVALAVNNLRTVAFFDELVFKAAKKYPGACCCQPKLSVPRCCWSFRDCIEAWCDFNDSNCCDYWCCLGDTFGDRKVAKGLDDRIAQEKQRQQRRQKRPLRRRRQRGRRRRRRRRRRGGPQAAAQPPVTGPGVVVVPGAITRERSGDVPETI